MTTDPIPGQSELETLDEAIANIDSESIRESVERLTDRRAQHYALSRYREDEVVPAVTIRESKWVFDYLRFLKSRDETIETVSKDQVSAYFDHRNSFGLAPGTATLYRRALRRLHAHLWRVFDIQSVPPSSFTKGEMTAQIEATPYANIQLAEVRRLSRAAKSRRDELIILMSHQAALAASSITALRRSDYDPARGYVLVEQDGRRRRVPLLHDLNQQLQRWVEQEHPEAPLQEGPIFPNQRGNHLQSRCSLSRVVTEAAEHAGIQTHRHRLDGRTERRLTGKALRRSGLDHWRADGVPDNLCDLFTTGQPRREFEPEPTARELSAFETFREVYNP